MVNIDTPTDQRRRMNIGDIWINAAKCEGCGDEIRSRNRHDFVTCGCGAISVDGGSWYAKRSFTGEVGFTNIIVSFNDVVES